MAVPLKRHQQLTKPSAAKWATGQVGRGEGRERERGEEEEGDTATSGGANGQPCGKQLAMLSGSYSQLSRFMAKSPGELID